MNRRTRLTGTALALAGALTLAAAEPSAAQERPAMSELTCGNARTLVASRGAVVVSTGPQGYERVVRDAGFCGLDESTSPAYLASADERQCFVGYRCRPIEHGESKE